MSVDGAWFLEAWDPMGGRGLASRRAARAGSPPWDLEMPTLGGSPTIYVGPPGFEPELITKPSIALSAGRSGYFEQRVPAEGPEIGFPSAQAVAEFVRRGFVAGGGSRGGGEGGGAPVPEGEPPGEPDVPRDSIRWLSEYCSQFAIGVGSLGSSATADSAVPRLRLDTKEPQASETDPVAWGAAELIGAMLAVYPNDRTDTRAGRWERAAASLAFALQELDLWRLLAQPGNRHGPTTYLRQVVSVFWTEHVDRRGSLPSNLEESFIDIVWIAFTEAPYLSRDFRAYASGRWIEMALYGYPFGHTVGAPATHKSFASRFEPMYSWPLSARSADVLKGQFPGGVMPGNVGQLLSLLLASPGAFQFAPPTVFRAVCFAAAFLASSLDDRQHADWRVRAAHAWLARSLPRWLFERRLEDLIAAVPTGQAMPAPMLAI